MGNHENAVLLSGSNTSRNRTFDQREGVEHESMRRAGSMVAGAARESHCMRCLAGDMDCIKARWEVGPYDHCFGMLQVVNVQQVSLILQANLSLSVDL